MKTKKFTKLSLNKTTIANLGKPQMAVAKGGAYTDTPGCSDPGSTCRFCPSALPLCQPSANCIPTESEETYCDCPSFDLPCPTDNC